MPEGSVDLAFLAELDRPGLVRLWKDLFGTAVPKSLSRPLACRYLAFELQSRSLGGLASNAFFSQICPWLGTTRNGCSSLLKKLPQSD
jgi:hypothetical protein